MVDQEVVISFAVRWSIIVSFGKTEENKTGKKNIFVLTRIEPRSR